VVTDDLLAMMVRDLRALGREVAAYPSDAALWQAVPGVTNTGGTLALHLVGNIQHFVGTVLGGGSYQRDRDAEFKRRDATRAELAGEVARAIAAVEGTLPRVTTAQLAAEYPLEVGGRRLPTSRFLTHLVSHLAYHLGQVDYHRRMVAPSSGTAGTMSLTEL
jgi:uncharacterized damage-inducible protein DinB